MATFPDAHQTLYVLLITWSYFMGVQFGLNQCHYIVTERRCFKYIPFQVFQRALSKKLVNIHVPC
jgi:hypothetical protein